MKPSFSRWIRPLLGLGVTVFFLWLLWGQIDLAEVGTAISRVSVSSLLVALLFLAADFTLRIVRWWWMLRAFDPQLPLTACGWPYLVSISLNNLLPFRAGDAVRVFGFQRELHSPAMRLLGTLFIERLLDLMTLLAIFFIGLLFVAEGKLPTTFLRPALWIAATGVVAVFALLMFSGRMERLIHWLADRPWLAKRGWSEQIKNHCGHFLAALGLLRTPSLLLQLVAMSVAAWGFEGAVFATVGYALNVPTLGGPWFALATGTLGTLLPSSPGYVGTFDYLAMLGLNAYGVERDLGVAFAFIIHLVLWLPLTVVGMTYFLRPGAHVVRRNATAALSVEEESK